MMGRNSWMGKHWYQKHSVKCFCCGTVYTWRKRVYGEKPAGDTEIRDEDMCIGCEPNDADENDIGRAGE